MKQYQDLVKHVLKKGVAKEDRTGTGTISTFGYQMRFDLQKGFPLVTTKKVHFKGVAVELLWFLRGDTNTKYLRDNGVTIWDEWADQKGDLGPIYGKQWRRWEAVKHQPTVDGSRYAISYQYDQIKLAIDTIKKDPDSRRIIVSAWNVADLPDMALAPCHAFFQFYVAQGKLSCQLYQRSADVFLGVPYNIASYALLTHMIAHVCALEVGEFIWSGGDIHIYSNHMNQIKEQMKRQAFELPTLKIARDVHDIDDFKYEDFVLENYQHHPAIKAPVAV